MIRLIVADESHTAAVAELFAALFEEVEHTPTAEEIAALFQEIEEDDRHSTLLALDDDDDVVGALSIAETISIYAGGYIGVVNELYVTPEYRSEGVGKMLLDAAKALAEERGWKRIELTTPGDEFEKTLRFYEREGFTRIGPRYRYIVE
jgi:GNAT superfamily N-acetyltransferase